MRVNIRSEVLGARHRRRQQYGKCAGLDPQGAQHTQRQATAHRTRQNGDGSGCIWLLRPKRQSKTSVTGASVVERNARATTVGANLAANLVTRLSKSENSSSSCEPLLGFSANCGWMIAANRTEKQLVEWFPTAFEPAQAYQTPGTVFLRPVTSTDTG